VAEANVDLTNINFTFAEAEYFYTEADYCVSGIGYLHIEADFAYAEAWIGGFETRFWRIYACFLYIYTGFGRKDGGFGGGDVGLVEEERGCWFLDGDVGKAERAFCNQEYIYEKTD